MTQYLQELAVIYDVNEMATIYASYSESFAPVAGDQYASLKADFTNIDPNSFENTEFGFKYDLLNGLTLHCFLLYHRFFCG